jgi:hypothetical protein
LYDKIAELADALVEQYMGLYGRPRMPPNATVAIPNMTKRDMTDLLHQGIAFLESTAAMPPDTHLQNLRDELTAAMAKALYLLTLE